MPATLAGFPFWIVEFDERGDRVAPANERAFRRDVVDADLTDLFVFVHGWNNSRGTALDRYTRFFATVRDLLGDATLRQGREARIGVGGVLWPSIRWADEDADATAVGDGGAAGFAGAAAVGDAVLVEKLKQVFPRPDQQAALDELALLLEERPNDRDELARFQSLMKVLVRPGDAAAAPEDSGENVLVEEDAVTVFRRLSRNAAGSAGEGGPAAGMLGDGLGKLWDGAKEALRAVTYWEMKQRAGIVGSKGLGPLLGRLHGDQTDLRMHLIGHSFGARAVSFSLQGLPGAAGDASPVKSVLLLQGAFSHYAFASKLPHDRDRGGALAGLAARVAGPLLVTHSAHDLALGKPYALASMTTGEDAAAFETVLRRWGAMGNDGAQAVDAKHVALGRVGASYPFAAGAFVNLNGDNVIKTRLSRINGAHSDIVHPEIAWAVLLAAGILAPGQ